MVIEGAPDYTHLRVLQGKDAGGILRIVALDPSGKIIMLPYGWDGTKFIPLLVDEEGRSITVIKGVADVTWGLRGWWKFIASEETTIKDYSGYGNNGAALSGAGDEANYSDGVIGQALVLDGTDDQVEIPEAASVTITGNDQRTAEAWIKIDNYTNFNMIYSYGAILILEKFSFSTHQGSGMLSIFLEGDDHISTTPVPIGAWHHVACTLQETTTKLYLDGVLVSTKTDHLSVNTAPSIVRIGTEINENPVTFFDGMIDEVRVYARVLSDDEILWRYNNTNPATGKPTRMVAVDNEGHMMVSVMDLPYKDQILFSKFEESGSAAATIQLYSDPVPSGRMWVINSVCLFHDTDAISDMRIGIDRGGVMYYIQRLGNAGNNDSLELKVPIYLKGGDKIRSFFYPVANGVYCWMTCNGYALNLP